jgi:hypothetical protein
MWSDEQFSVRERTEIIVQTMHVSSKTKFNAWSSLCNIIVREKVTMHVGLQVLKQRPMKSDR